MSTKPGLGTDITIKDPTRPSAPAVGSGSSPAGQPARGDSIGRFVVLGLLGSGGMGNVYSGYDPHLDRKVAIKLLHAEIARSNAADGRTRLLREAQAMAKIDHPNVIKVHEVGTFGEQVYLAMEFADGGTLRAWLQARPRAPREIIERFAQAGRGLAAAHAAGLVHRDFKPDNVLLAKDGSVRVTDFGLVSVLAEPAPRRAPTADPAREPTAVAAISELETSALSQSLTRTGSVMGTPSYMAPEQFLGQPATARTDQFAFCVALYEALYAERPFPGDTFAELTVNVTTGEVRPAPKDTKVPGRLRRLLLRGLARAADDRFPSMDALLAELVPARSRRWPVLALAGGVAALAGGAGVFLALGRGGDARPSCASQAASRAGEVWSEATTQQIAARFAKTGKSYADSAARAASASLDKYAAHWRDLSADVCSAERASIGPPPELVVRRRVCLDARLDALRGVVALLAGEDRPEYVEHAQAMVDGLPDLAACTDLDALQAGPSAPPAALAAAAARLDRDVATARARGNGGEYARARRELAALAQQADTLGWAPVQARAHLAYGERLALEADPAAAGELARAGELATETHLDREAAKAWSLSLLAAGNARRGDVVAALEPVAQGAAARTGDRELEVSEHVVYGRALARTRQLEPAAKTCRDALATAQSLDQPKLIAAADDCLLEALVPAGAFGEVEPLVEQMIDRATKELGPDHPRISDYLMVRKDIELRRGKLAEARRDADRVLDIRRRAYAANDFEIGEALAAVADVARAQGNQDDARKLDEQAYAIVAPQTSNPHAQVLAAQIDQELAFQLEASGDHAGAIRRFEEAVALTRKAHGDDSLELAFLLLNYGQVMASDDFAAGLAILNQGRSILEARHDKRVSMVAGAMAVIEVAHGKWSDARDHAEEALAHSDADIPPQNVALVKFLLAQALVATHGDRKQARSLAQEARAIATKLGPSHAKLIAQMDRWLEAH